MEVIINKPTEESLERAKIHLLRSISDNKPNVLKKILENGYPVDNVIIDITQTTILMFCF